MLKQLYRFFSPKHQNIFLEYRVDPRPRFGHGLPTHAGLEKIISARTPQYHEIVKRILALKDALQTIQHAVTKASANDPYWDNGFFPGLDIASLYAMLTHHRPGRYIEIGSGNSTMVARRAIREQQLPTHILSIDPNPRAEIDQLTDEILRLPFEQCPLTVFQDLEPGDFVFVDNSHRIFPNSDATVFFLEVLPQLPPGVIVQIHDVYLPDDYPDFMCNRYYSEQYMLAAFLLSAPQRYRPLFPCWWVSQQPDFQEMLAELWQHPNLEKAERHGGSFWLEIGTDQ